MCSRAVDMKSLGIQLDVCLCHDRYLFLHMPTFRHETERERERERDREIDGLMDMAELGMR